MTIKKKGKLDCIIKVYVLGFGSISRVKFSWWIGGASKSCIQYSIEDMHDDLR
jgi:hypothetical protein